MGPLTRRIQSRRSGMQARLIMENGRRSARIAAAIHLSKDGGLLVHQAIENGTLKLPEPTNG